MIAKYPEEYSGQEDFLEGHLDNIPCQGEAPDADRLWSITAIFVYLTVLWIVLLCGLGYFLILQKAHLRRRIRSRVNESPSLYIPLRRFD